MLDCLKINLIDCRGQSYHNANNMSGSYKSLQARIRELNPLDFHIPYKRMGAYSAGFKSICQIFLFIKICL